MLENTFGSASAHSRDYVRRNALHGTTLTHLKLSWDLPPTSRQGLLEESDLLEFFNIL